MAENYVGVSGVGTPEQQAAVESQFQGSELSTSRKLLLGVKATTKIQVDEVDSRKGRNWFPVGDELRTALSPGDDSLKVLQLYADDWTDLDGRAIPLIENSLARSESWVDGLQYDLLPWFTEESSVHIIKRYAHGTVISGPVIVQCHGDIMQTATPEQLLERLKCVEGYITHVLFDASEGRGLTMDADTLSRWVEVVQKSDLDINVTIAGGLGSEETAGLLIPVLKRFDDISWDAESRLHTNNILDSYKVAQYLKDSQRSLASTEVPRKVARDIRTMGEWSIWLAHIERQPTYLDGRHENDSEHATMLSRVGFNIALKYFPEFDAGKVAIFSTIHDDIEGYTGDFPSLGATPEAMIAKQEREDAAFRQMKIDFADFPHYIELIEQYEQQTEPEARFVKVLDKCMPPILNLYNMGKSVLEEQNIQTADEYTELAKVSSARLTEYGADLGVLIETREALIEMIRAEIYDPETGHHLRRFATKKDE